MLQPETETVTAPGWKTKGTSTSRGWAGAPLALPPGCAIGAAEEAMWKAQRSSTHPDAKSADIHRALVSPPSPARHRALLLSQSPLMIPPSPTDPVRLELHARAVSSLPRLEARL